MRRRSFIPGILGMLLGIWAPAHAGPGGARVSPLKEVWRAPFPADGAVLVGTGAGPRVAAFEAREGSPGRSVVLFDPQTGAVKWRTAPASGVEWTGMTVGEDSLLLTGQRASGPTVVMAKMRVDTGVVSWSVERSAPATLVSGADGAVGVAGDCRLEVLNPSTGALIQPLRGRPAVPGTTAGAAPPQDALQGCGAMPRLLGRVGKLDVVLEPDAQGSGWRYYAVEGVRLVWESRSGATETAPENDWRTSSFWTLDTSGVHLERRDLSSGKLQLQTVVPSQRVQPKVRPVRVAGRGPALLADLGDEVVAFDPHDGLDLWRARVGDALPLLANEAPLSPEPIQPGPSAVPVVWLSDAGVEVGRAVVPLGTLALNVADGLLQRDRDSVSLRDREDKVRWTLPLAVGSWWCWDDLVVLTPSAGGSPLVVSIASGAILGSAPEGATAVAIVPALGTSLDLAGSLGFGAGRLLIVNTGQLQALRIPGR